MYKGVAFHIQTEDSGSGKPLITTLLYRDGTIIASKKTDYSDIIKIEMLEKVVEDLMKEQHKEVLRRLKAGEFDNRAFPSASSTDNEPEYEEKAVTTSEVTANSSKKDHPSGQSLDDMILEYLASDKD
jgi:ketol-acid reductoisomerase